MPYVAIAYKYMILNNYFSVLKGFPQTARLSRVRGAGLLAVHSEMPGGCYPC
jgi:hypothetical protein